MNLKRPTNDDSFAQVEAVFTEELQSLYRYACYRLGEREAAQDVIQELYLKLHRQGLGEVRNVRCYLYRALSNSCTQLLRNRRRIEFVDVTSLRDLHAEDITPADFEQEQALIARLLAALPDEQSEVIRLHLHGECTFTEIAEILDEPLPTVKSRYRYGIEHLRKELQKQNFI
jgi:RNA polymerase sigma-70 factor (ECF subfamily)